MPLRAPADAHRSWVEEALSGGCIRVNENLALLYSSKPSLSACRERMAHHYNSSRRTLVFNVGDVVSLRIPRIDRTSSDQPRPPCIVVEVKGKAQNLYLLR